MTSSGMRTLSFASVLESFKAAISFEQTIASGCHCANPTPQRLFIRVRRFSRQKNWGTSKDSLRLASQFVIIVDTLLKSEPDSVGTGPSRFWEKLKSNSCISGFWFPFFAYNLQLRPTPTTSPPLFSISKINLKALRIFVPKGSLPASSIASRVYALSSRALTALVSSSMRSESVVFP